LKERVMDELDSITVTDERLKDCRDVVKPDLQDLIRTKIASGVRSRKS
jgi:hypothetical protein